MKHFLKAKHVNTQDKQIKNKEILNLIEERDVIEVGTQVVVDISVSGDYILEVVKIDGKNVWWEIKEVSKNVSIL